ncbi:DUF4054 domain-containing protein [Novosphingobium sp. FSY-8]|uniref:DUF4054 domain-containing protein n=1 Tax=Novosphingobium ovatum TaxID=1908523 RepID=A0ABW9XFU7_9SPHN|nr:DUF4054 domain-containing protein [Novosphingobium ovatum]
MSAASDEAVTLWLAEAAVDCATFPEAIRARAEMAYAAHRLVEVGVVAGAVPAGVTSFKSGTFSATVADAAASRTGFAATAYGQEFITLRRRAFAGPRLAWTPPAGMDC